MRCREARIREILPEYLALRLPPGKARMIRDHLETCSECRQELAIIKHFADESVPEPPVALMSAMPGKVTSVIGDRKRRAYRLPVPVWAGGLAIAALVILFIISPWKNSGISIVVPGEYYAEVSGRLELGLEEEILLDSGLDAEALDRSLDQEIFSSVDLYDLGSLDDAYRTGLFEGMDDIILRKFEKLIDEISPVNG